MTSRAAEPSQTVQDMPEQLADGRQRHAVHGATLGQLCTGIAQPGAQSCAGAGIIDYVITHEMCHVLYSNHGPEFDHLLIKIMPAHALRKAKLELVFT